MVLTEFLSIKGISDSLFATIIWAEANKLCTAFHDPLRNAAREAYKAFKGKGLPFPASRVEAILAGGADPGKIEAFRRAEAGGTALGLAEALLDFESASLKEVPENLENAVRFVDAFKEAFRKRLLDNPRHALHALAALQEIDLQLTKEGYERLSGEIGNLRDALDERLARIEAGIQESAEFSKQAVDAANRAADAAEKAFSEKKAETPKDPLMALPPRTEHFTGRDAEVARLLADLRPGRVITLCGPGGIGKTALASEAVHRLLETEPERFPHGALFHTFYGQPETEKAFEQIALFFGEEIKSSPRDAAVRALAGKMALLILDGAEDAKDLRAVKDVAGGCGVLITSRNKADAGADRKDLQVLDPTPALKVLRNWAAGQSMDEETGGRICELVGRLPLALRLAGACMAHSGQLAGQYLAWLESSPLEALDHGKRRLESVPVLLEKSMAQVGEDARRAMGVVGMLAFASFRPEAVAYGLGLKELDPVWKPLGELAKFGLLQPRDGRYEVCHRLVYQHAQAADPGVDALERLAGFFAAYARAMSGKKAEGFALLAPERPHFMRLLKSCYKRDIYDSVFSLEDAVDDFLDYGGYWLDWKRVLELGLYTARGNDDRKREGQYLGNLGLAYAALGKVEKAIGYYDEALSISREIGDRRGEGSDLGNLGLAYFSLGKVEKAIGYYDEALSISREIGDRRGEGSDLGNLGNAYAALGKVEKAIGYYDEALSISREIGDRRGEGTDLGNLGNAYFSLGKVEKAIGYYDEALSISREIGDRRGEGNHLGNLGNAYAELGKVEKAIGYYDEALSISREIGDRSGEGNHLGNLGNAYFSLGKVEKAIGYYEKILIIHREIGDRRGEGTDLGNLGNAYAALGKVEKAIGYYDEALSISREIGDRRGEGNRLGNLGNAYAELGKVEKAIGYYDEALSISREIGDRRGEGFALANIGIARIRLGEKENGLLSLESAMAIFNEIRSPNAAKVRGILERMRAGGSGGADPGGKEEQQAAALAYQAHKAVEEQNYRKASGLSAVAIVSGHIPDGGLGMIGWFQGKADELKAIVENQDTHFLERGGALAFFAAMGGEEAKDYTESWLKHESFEEAAKVCLSIFRIWQEHSSNSGGAEPPA